MSQTPMMTINRLDISGKRDVVMGKYCAWQQEQVESEEQKADYQKACDYLIDEAMDLELIYQDQTVADDLRTKAGVKRGIAQRVVGEVGHWAKNTDYDVPHFVDATACTDDPHRSELDIPQFNEAARKAESARLRDASILQLLRYGSH
jgi:hypothetical protein